MWPAYIILPGGVFPTIKVLGCHIPIRNLENARALFPDWLLREMWPWSQMHGLELSVLCLKALLSCPTLPPWKQNCTLPALRQGPTSIPTNHRHLTTPPARTTVVMSPTAIWEMGTSRLGSSTAREVWRSHRYMDIGGGWGCLPHPAVLRAYSCLCIQRSLLVKLGGLYGCQGWNPD